MADSPFIVTVTAQNFHQIVIDGSHDRPVLVDFWADWCAPCRALMPILAKLADQYAGKFLLAKLDTEAEREVAAQFGIRSLPTVQLFKDGKAVDEFMGALPEAQVRAFLDRHIPREADILVARAEALMAERDLADAAAPDCAGPAIGAQSPPGPHRRGPPQGPGRRYRRGGGADRGGFPSTCWETPRSWRSAASCASPTCCAPPTRSRNCARAWPPTRADSEARYQLAAHCIARSDFEGALELLFELMRRDRSYGDDAGRKGMLLIFDLLGGTGEVVSRWRSRMFTAMH